MAPAPFPITTPDGTCPARAFRPTTGTGPWPGVLMLMDGIGIRPALFEMAQHLADAGYVVLLPDVFYRAGEYTAPDPKTLFGGDPSLRTEWFKRMVPDRFMAKVMSDTRAYLDALAAQPGVKPGARGVIGYCMGGRLALGVAGTFPDDIGAAASIHGGQVGSDAPDSPHLLAPHMRCKVYTAAGDNDAPEQQARLDAALTAAGVDHVCEVYPAHHGWVPRDTPVHDAAQTERHWKAVTELFRRAIG